jgi:hypothetical protein
MTSQEQLPVGNIDSVESTKVPVAPEKRPSELIYGSAEMIATRTRLMMDRAMMLGSSAGQLTLDIRPVTERLDT